MHATVKEHTLGFWRALHDDDRLALHSTIYTWPAAQMQDGWVLDLGCEYGIGSLLIAESNPKLQVFGLDVDLPALRYSQRESSGGSIPWVNADASALPLASESLSGIYLINLLNLVEEPARILSEVWRTLKPAGIAVIGVPREADRPADRADTQQLAAEIEALFAEVLYPEAISGTIPSFPSRSFRLNEPTSPWIAICRKDPIWHERGAG